MEKYFRLKIDELNNGTKKYILQHGKLIIGDGWIKTQRLVFSDIYREGFDTEEEAMKTLENIKLYNSKQEGKKIKSTTYKSL